ncbi:MAG TPA: RNA polymerase sigma factor region1.1 domain-containing protein, partial [Nitrososphaera sp.]|nr:RNA polymerase sigma factor region1.1 domain-containing protein [Nitrososphaera sp.]
MAQQKPVRTRQRRTKKTYEKEIAQLMSKGKKDGKLDQRDIFALIPDTPANIDVLESLYSELAESDIEVIQLEAPEPE